MIDVDNRIRRQANQDFTNVHSRKLQRLKKLMANKPVSEWRILDIGCGYHFPQEILFEGKVALICGVDLEPVFLRDGFLQNLRTWCGREGLFCGVKHSIIFYAYYSLYHRYLAQLTGKKTDFKRLSLSTYDGIRIPYDNDYFDVVTSSAVLEHVIDLEVFFSECNRVLRNGGVVDMWWHNFYCPSGSHLDKASLRSKPWGHVTGELTTQSRFGLNRKRPDEIKQVFEKYFQVLKVVPSDCKHRLIDESGYESEGLQLLDLEWSKKLIDIPQDLLTTTGFVIQGVKIK